jgi:hypothetical protein
MTLPNETPAESTQIPAGDGDMAKKDYVALETHRKLLDEKKKIQLRLEEFEVAKKAKDEEDARKRGDFEAILKAREEELHKERERRTHLEASLIRAEKMDAVINALGGNIDPKWMKLIDVSKVVINPETGEIDAMTVSTVAETLKRDWPEMVKPSSRLPADAPQGLHGGSGKISRLEWMKLSSKEMMKWKPDQIID